MRRADTHTVESNIWWFTTSSFQVFADCVVSVVEGVPELTSQ
jgi:hypothetical protein